MKDLAIYGAGGFGREVDFLIEQINHNKKRWNVIGFFDDGDISTNPHRLNILGNLNQLNNHKYDLDVVIAIANPRDRFSIASKIRNSKINFPLISHPNTNLGSGKNRIGRGAVITDGCRLTTGIMVDEFVIINLNTTVGHDSRIGSFSSIMPGAHISGNVNIGEQVLVGTGAVILQNLTLGNHARVGAGAVVTKDVGGGQTVVGIPARIKRV